jgi:hypothetical protein
VHGSGPEEGLANCGPGLVANLADIFCALSTGFTPSEIDIWTELPPGGLGDPSPFKPTRPEWHCARAGLIRRNRLVGCSIDACRCALASRNGRRDLRKLVHIKRKRIDPMDDLPERSRNILEATADERARSSWRSPRAVASRAWAIADGSRRASSEGRYLRPSRTLSARARSRPLSRNGTGSYAKDSGQVPAYLPYSRAWLASVGLGGRSRPPERWRAPRRVDAPAGTGRSSTAPQTRRGSRC